MFGEAQRAIKKTHLSVSRCDQFGCFEVYRGIKNQWQKHQPAKKIRELIKRFSNKLRGETFRWIWGEGRDIPEGGMEGKDFLPVLSGIYSYVSWSEEAVFLHCCRTLQKW